MNDNRLAAIAIIALAVLALAVLANVAIMVVYFELAEHDNNTTVYVNPELASQECSTYQHEQSDDYFILCETDDSTTVRRVEQ